MKLRNLLIRANNTGPGEVQTLAPTLAQLPPKLCSNFPNLVVVDPNGFS